MEMERSVRVDMLSVMSGSLHVVLLLQRVCHQGPPCLFKYTESPAGLINAASDSLTAHSINYGRFGWLRRLSEAQIFSQTHVKDVLPGCRGGEGFRRLGQAG